MKHPAGEDLAQQHFPQAYPPLQAYANLLVTKGIDWGLIGPQEADRIWGRHILNCAAPADLREAVVPERASVVDVGSGAGLPGIVWALVRPDLTLTLLEPLQRRCEFLELAIGELGLTHRVNVVRQRAEEAKSGVQAQVATARAVAHLRKLAGWLLPLVQPGGLAIAIKGASVHNEIEAARKELTAAGAGSVEVRTCGETWLPEPSTIAVLQHSK